MRPRTYWLQDPARCKVCAYVFEKGDYESSPEYFCTFGAPPRPASMSVAMGECPDYDEMEDAFKVWDAWSKGREVDPLGICSHYARAPREEAERG